jgi:hypothetical protein
MGLDMYLKASKYVGGWSFSSEEEKNQYAKVLEAADIPLASVSSGTPLVTVEINVAYWRKANAIHSWFVLNAQDGKDDCQTSYVSREQLTELVNLCKTVLETKDATGLPPQAGFFFCSTEIDEGYWHDVKHTIKQIESALNNEKLKHFSFYYRASW